MLAENQLIGLGVAHKEIWRVSRGFEDGGQHPFFWYLSPIVLSDNGTDVISVPLIFDLVPPWLLLVEQV